MGVAGTSTSASFLSLSVLYRSDSFYVSKFVESGVLKVSPMAKIGVIFSQSGPVRKRRLGILGCCVMVPARFLKSQAGPIKEEEPQKFIAVLGKRKQAVAFSAMLGA